MELAYRPYKDTEQLTAALEYALRNLKGKAEAVFTWNKKNYHLFPNGDVVAEFAPREEATADRGEVSADIEVIWKRLTRRQ